MYQQKERRRRRGGGQDDQIANKGRCSIRRGEETPRQRQGSNVTRKGGFHWPRSPRRKKGTGETKRAEKKNASGLGVMSNLQRIVKTRNQLLLPAQSPWRRNWLWRKNSTPYGGSVLASALTELVRPHI